MAKQRKPSRPIKPSPGLQIVPAPARPSVNLGLDQAAADEMRELIRSINQNRKKKDPRVGNDDLPPAA